MGANGFLTPHNMTERKGVGVCTTDPLVKKSPPKWLKEMWTLGKELIMDIDPIFGSGRLNNFFSLLFTYIFVDM